MEKKFLALVLMIVIIGSLGMFQGYATLNWGYTTNLGDVRIGVILPDWGYNQAQTIIFKLAEQDINSKLRVSGATAHFTFDIKVVDEWNSHQSWVKYFYNQDPPVDLIIGGYYSSQARDSLSYINENQMLLFSPSSTATDIANPNDGLFRMCANDALGQKPLNDMMVSRGIQHVIILHTDESWINYLVSSYMSVNTIPKVDSVTFYGGDKMSAYLSDASALVNSNEKTAVLVYWGGTDVSLYQIAMNYPALSNLDWFGVDTPNLDIQLYAPSESAKLHLYSPQGAVFPEAQTQFNSLKNRVSAITDYTLNPYDGNAYDIAWVIAKSVLTAKSATASDVINVLPNVSRNYFGVTGYRARANPQVPYSYPQLHLIPPRA